MKKVCFRTGRVYQSEDFPKRCAYCHATFPTREDYIDRTGMPHSGRSCCYHRKKDLIIEMRQCMCNNTMAVMVEDSRDYSIKGVVKRVLFKKLVSRSMELLQSRNEMAFLNQLKTIMRRI